MKHPARARLSPFSYRDATFRTARAHRWALLLATWLVCFAASAPARAQALAHPSTTPQERPEALIAPESLVVPALPDWLIPPLELAETPARPETEPLSIRTRFIESQHDVESRSEFVHYAYRIETEAGLQQAGQVSLDFAPSYQTLQWHRLRVWRDGQARDALDPSRVQILRREENAERFLYHGRLTALMILHDLRVGDEIEVAYTRIGENPVFAGRFSTWFNGANSSPIDRLRYRLRTAPGRPVRLAAIGDFQPSHHVETAGDREDHVWSASDLKAVHPLGDVPTHEAQFSYLQITEFSSWDDVRLWARELFQQADQPSPVLAERIAALVKSQNHSSPREVANTVLRFVQDDIRYLGLHFQESTHRPAPPALSLERRFGDCKDKSLLLVALLRQLGIEAEVALVNSTWSRGLKNLQPSPLSFDHAIVRARLRGEPAFRASVSFSANPQDSLNPALKAPDFGNTSDTYLWLDPTLTLQGGAFDQRHLPDYGYALLLDSGPGRLAPITVPSSARSRIDVATHYTVPDYTSPARLEIITTYRGAAADAYRYYRRVTNPEQNTRDFTGFLERFLPRIKATAPLNWDDNREANVLISRLNLELPDFWTHDAKGDYRLIEVFPWSLSQRLPRPETAERSRSFALPHPADWSEHCTITLPKEWPAHSQSQTINDDTFAFSYETRTEGNRVSLSYRWRTLTDSVPAERMQDWTRKMNEVRATFGYQLQQNIRLADAVEKIGVVWSLVACGVFGALAGLAVGWWFYRRRPVVSEEIPLGDRHLVGIGGWLILLAIGVTMRPFILVSGMVADMGLVRDLPTWITLTDSESVGYNAGFAWLAWAEFFVHGLLIVWSVVLVPQFFRLKATAPRAQIAFFITFATWLLVDQIAAGLIMPSGNPSDQARQIGQMIGAWIGPAVWVAYLLNSRRVRATFRR